VDNYSALPFQISPEGRIVVPQVFVRRVALQSINIQGVIQWDTVDSDTDQMFDFTLPDWQPGTRIWINTPGAYGITVNVWWDSTLAAGTDIGLLVNRYTADDPLFGHPIGNDERDFALSGSITIPVARRFDAGDSIDVQARQESGAPKNTGSGISLSAVYLSG
jgi:hypothetical protein